MENELLSRYIILPGKSYGEYEYPDLLVGVGCEIKGRTWMETHKKSHERDSFLLNPRQFLDLVIMLIDAERPLRRIYFEDGKKAKGDEIKQILLEGVYKMSDGFVVEALDGRFLSGYNDEDYMLFDHHVVGGDLVPRRVAHVKLLDSIGSPYRMTLIRKFDKFGIPTRASLTDDCSIDGRETAGCTVPHERGYRFKRFKEEGTVVSADNINGGCAGISINYGDFPITDIKDKHNPGYSGRLCRLYE